MKRRHSPDWASQLAQVRIAGGRIRRARWNPGGRTLELVLRVLEGDGWTELLLRYRNVERLEPPLPALARLVEDRATQLADHALEAAAGCWQHRLEPREGPAIVVRFADLHLADMPVGGPEAPEDAGHRFEVLSC